VADGLEAVETCQLCGGREISHLHEGCPDRIYGIPGLFDVVTCRRCGLAWTSPRPRKEAIARYYPDRYADVAEMRSTRGKTGLRGALRSATRVPYRLRYRGITDTPAPRPGASRLLDVGSSSGSYLARMQELGWEPWGVEPHAEARARALERLRVPEDRIFHGSAEDADFPAESFDLVTMSHVLEHLYEPKAVLKRVRGWLRPEGRLRVWVPNLASFESKVFGRFWTGLDLPRHLFHFTPSTLARMLRDAGFDVERAVPEFQTGSLTGSAYFAARAAVRQHGPGWPPHALHYALLPLGSVLIALGNAGAIDVTATRG
jgi:SAM-dependent methyltransferase